MENGDSCSLIYYTWLSISGCLPKIGIYKTSANTEKNHMNRILSIALLSLFLSAGESAAWYVTIHDEPEDDRRNGGVVFPLTNNTAKNIERVFGWVYRYKEENPKNPLLVSNPHIAATKITPGPHKPGEKALYWFKVPEYLLSVDKFGVVVYDASIRFSY